MNETLIAGRFAPQDFIGQGACGTVVEAMDIRLRRLVALKLVRRGTDGIDAHRITAEARAAARLVHPNIIAVHDAGDGRDFAWIAMELVIGEPLSALLAREKRLPVADATRVTLQLLDALDHAHGRGVIHRDVKPANILLAMDGEDGPGRVRLGDFGLARMGSGEETELGTMMGTPAWMAPEQVRGEVVDHRADLWAVGVILYESLTGKRPFEGGMPALLTRILSDTPPAPSTLASMLDPAWDAVLAQALAKIAGERFQNAAAMAQAVRAVQARSTSGPAG